MTARADASSIFPAWVDRLQLKYMNPVVRRVGPYLPMFAVIEHRGRKSGKQYSTPVNVLRFDGKLAVVLGHGITDWVRNVRAAGEARVRYSGRTWHATNPRIIERGTGGAELPAIARMMGRRFGVFVVDIERN
ncbi:MULTISPECIES: nitroreductase family deazaflavin-dependent oxidoreductase [unclassified Nocardia]|uniref:nitroreductase family deazaflavin-dependent oxidoreductase n=1 Tax=unclassified Nocardia TaxID=2637762 RepID=UPI001CE3C1E4|nr:MULTISPECIES: nitroreductase family deazaflavin-dependent oxidoreductase [unclassified Nocardia]